MKFKIRWKLLGTSFITANSINEAEEKMIHFTNDVWLSKEITPEQEFDIVEEREVCDERN